MGREERAKSGLVLVDAGDKAIADVIATSRKQLMDRFGRPILEGGDYLFNAEQPHLFRVRKVTPILERVPNLPPGVPAYRVELSAYLVITMIGGQPADQLVMVNAPAQEPPGETAPPVDPQLPMEPGPVTLPAASLDYQTEPPASPNVAAEEPPHGQNEGN